MKDTKRTKSKAYFSFAVGLLYPAILGSLIYVILERIADGQFFSTPLKITFTILILIEFIVDYIYTTTDERKGNYGLAQSICDSFIVIGLFIAVNAALRADPFKNLAGHISLILGIVKVFAFLWEIFMPPKDRIAIILFGLFAVTYSVNYAICGVVYMSSSLLVILSLDIIVYLLFNSIKKTIKVILK